MARFPRCGLAGIPCPTPSNGVAHVSQRNASQPPSRALLVAELPVFGRARAFIGGKLPVFGEPRTRRRFSEKYHAVSEKSLLDAGIIWSGRWASIVLALPKPDGALVESRALSRGLVVSCLRASAPRARSRVHQSLASSRLPDKHANSITGRRIWRSLRIYVSLRCKFIMMESVPRSVWKRGRATLPPGTSPGSA